jgi:tryptophanyl-tRNA synthetase
MLARAPAVREARRAASVAARASTSRAASSSPSPSSAAAAPPPPRRIFSGIQPTGVPHLGNYLGALRSWLELQQADAAASAPEHAAAGAAASGPAGSTHVFFSIVGLHALTVPQAGKQLRRERRAMLRCLLAIGIDPARCTLFHQEQVRVVRWKGTPGRRGGLRVGDHKSCEAAGDCALRAGSSGQ